MDYELSDLFTKTITEIFGCDSASVQYTEHTHMDGDSFSGFMRSSIIKELYIHIVFLNSVDFQLDRAYKAEIMFRGTHSFKNGQIVEYRWQNNDRGDISINTKMNVHDAQSLLKEMQEYARIKWEKEFTTKMDDLCIT